MNSLPRLLCLFLLSTILLPALAEVDPPDGNILFNQAKKLEKDGNYKEAYEAYRKLLLGDLYQEHHWEALRQGVSCLQRINRDHESDAFREEVVARHPQRWQILNVTAQSYANANHTGYTVSGKFNRGPHRGGGQYMNSVERDRVRALQLYQQAIQHSTSLKPEQRASLYYNVAQAMFANRQHHGAWTLQALTDTSELPDYEEGYPHRHHYQPGNRGAPITAAGTPVYYDLPATYEQARNDGERWRWLLWEAMELDENYVGSALFQWASFLHSQFGVQNMVQYSWFWRTTVPTSKDDSSGAYAVHTLTDAETITRLANGVHRFALPDEHNFIKLFRRVSNHGQGLKDSALEQLAQIYENRRQYPAAADAWRKVIKRSGPGHNNYRQKRLDQIVGNWGRFVGAPSQPAGQGAVFDFRFRNANRVTFTAHRIDVPALLEDVKRYLKSNPRQLDGNRIQIAQLGHSLVNGKSKKYVKERVASWSLKLDPARDHFDDGIEVTTPLQKAGAYLVTARTKSGNTCNIVLWVNDTVLVKMPLATTGSGEVQELQRLIKQRGKAKFSKQDARRIDELRKKLHVGAGDDKASPALVYVADAVTGKAVAGADVDFFGYRQEYLNKPTLTKRRYEIHTLHVAEKADRNGLTYPRYKDTHDKKSHNYQWIITATTPDGRFAHLGFSGIWHGRYYDHQYNQTKAYAMTDRPVYRPDQEVKFSFWVRQAQYDMDDVSQFAGRNFIVRIHDPEGTEVLKQNIQADAYGGIKAEHLLPKDAKLGVYGIYVDGYGARGTFRVEEYKKPEFEVTIDAPTEPVMLGEKIEATIKAKYYFGGAVTKAKVKYKVTRIAATTTWYAPDPWDWFYGQAYWWFAYDYPWYPGWHIWGCEAPRSWWVPWNPEPPEVVMENEVEIGEDGIVKVTIDTALAKAVHSDTDHRYSISAEITDESRRTITGGGNILVARRPFRVYAWVDHGYFRVGDTVRPSFSARRPDNKPVQGTGKVTLYKIRYNKKNEPSEKVVKTWKVKTDHAGKSSIQLVASEAGQYRVACVVTDAKGHKQEGGYVFSVRGKGYDARNYRFNHLELVPEKKNYRPGEKVNVALRTDRGNSTVLLFVRPSNGMYLPPRVVKLRGEEVIIPIEVSKRDMPNFFIEAVTVRDGKVHKVTREITVPPEKRVLNVELEPSKEKYKPGADAEVIVRITDHEGKPYQGSIVMSVYDRSVEYISGGSNVPEIREFFWKWRRSHQGHLEHSFQRQEGVVYLKGHDYMNNLGVFGGAAVPRGEGEKKGGWGSALGKSRSVRRNAMRRGELTRVMSLGAVAMDFASAAPMGAAELSMAFGDADGMEGHDFAGGGAATEPKVTVRKTFADTAHWVALLETDADGTATVKFPMPENLTAWKIRTWAVSHGTRVGEGTTEVITSKDLILRLQAPRFFVEKDEVTLSANIHNYLEADQDIRAIIELEGDSLEVLGDAQSRVTVKAGGETRVDWRVKVTREGEAVVRMKAIGQDDADAMEMRFPVYVHGMLKMDSFSTVVRPEQQSAKILFTVPKERRIAESRIEIRYSPTLAGAMVDALPYLANYPYGCTEQTLSRFLPTVLCRDILQKLGVDLESIREKTTNLNAQEIGDPKQRAEQWQHWSRNPVFDEEIVEDMVREGLKHLDSMQCSDGGWGWFSGRGERSYPHTTAYVVHGLMVARDTDVPVSPRMLKDGIKWLERYQAEQVRRIKNKKKWKNQADNTDAFVFMVLIDADVLNKEMRDFLYRDRTGLSAYGLSMVALSMHKLGETEKRDMLRRNIEQHLVTDDENQTAYLDLQNGGYWWYWYGSEFEAHAYYLKLLSAVDPKSETAAGLVKYLLNNRKHATYWNSTRDTAIVIEAMADYLKASGEDKPDMTVEVKIDGRTYKTVQITSSNLFTFDGTVVLEGDAVESGEHTLELVKTGTGPLYANVYVTYFSLEDFIKKAGLEIKVERAVYKLVPEDKSIIARGHRGQVVSHKVEKYKRVRLDNEALLKSGDLIEVELSIFSKNDYTYLVFEDFKAAGFEAVDVRSGYTKNAMHAYVEFRDERVAFFVRRLARGEHSVSYRLRAEIPGRFSALPARGYAMYAPELKGNSDEIKLRIED